MPSFEEARKIILDHVEPLGAEVVPILDAVGRVLAEDLAAPWDFPAWNNSAMDGYAVRAEDVSPDAPLRLSAYIPAGAAGAEPLDPGTAAKILTGAPLPAGAQRRDELLAWSAGNQDTGILKTMLQADGIAIIPAESGDVRSGSPVDVQVLRSGFEMWQA